MAVPEVERRQPLRLIDRATVGSRPGPWPRAVRDAVWCVPYGPGPGRRPAAQWDSVTYSISVSMLWSIISSVSPGYTPIQNVRSVVMSLLVRGPLTRNSRPS